MTAPRAVLAGIVVVFVVLSSLVALFTAPWEANDEPSHAYNVETLRSGSWYRIGDDAHLETHQPPLYYGMLAAYAEAIGLAENATDPVGKAAIDDFANNPVGVFRHDVPQDAADLAYVRRLRMLGVGLGALTVLLAAATAALLTRDRWTPVVAAAFVAFVPKFVFVSGVINNDNLANTLGALAVFLSVALAVRRWPARDALLCIALGVTVGAMALTKASTLFLIPGVALALLIGFRSQPRRLVLFGATSAVAALAVALWWFVLATSWYGDPLAASAAHDHFARVAPIIVYNTGSASALFDVLPSNVWHNFWYSSGWNQLRWSAWATWPYWVLLAGGLAGLTRRGSDTPRSSLGLLVVLALAGPAAVFALAMETNATEARVAFVSLTALGVLYALGVQRWAMPVIARFALPALGVIGTLVALRADVFLAYR